jgi:hypothetical protein
MYITSTRLSEILNWFQSSARFQFLLLFAAGDSRTATFIGSLFDQKETVDVVSSSQVAVFLFAPQIDSAISFELGSGHFAFAQGMRLDIEPAVPKRWQAQLPPKTISIRSFTDSGYREQVVRASVSATHELTAELGLGPKDVPAWVLFHRGYPEPLVVRTKGQEDIGQLIEFLKDLRQTEFRHIKAPRAAATSRRQRLIQARLHVEDAARRLDQGLDHWRKQVSLSPLDETIRPAEVTRENAIDVLKWPLGNALSSRGPTPEEPISEIQPRMTDSDVREIVRQWQRYQSAKKSVGSLQSEINEYVTAIDVAPSVVSHNDREIERLVMKYQALFQLQMAGAKLAAFIRVITGVGKQAKEMGDVIGKLRKALGDDA